MKRLMMFCSGCLASVLFCGTALSADTMEQYFGDYAYKNSGNCSSSLTLGKGGRDSYLIVVDNSCGDEERVGLCGGDFLVSIFENTKSGTVLRDSESGITFAVGPKGITVENVPTGFCGMGAYMHGDYVRGKKTSGTQKTQAPQPPKETIVCGTVKDEMGVSKDIATVFFIEFDDKDMYERKFKDGQVAFFYNDRAPAVAGFPPCNELVNESRKRDLLFCFTLTTRPTPPVLKQAGVKEDTVFWGSNCVLPN